MQSLQKNYLFSDLDAAQFEHLRAHIQIRYLEKGEMLFRQGDAAPAFFVVTQGGMALYRMSVEGHEKIMRMITPYQSFAESVMFMAEPRYPVHARATQASALAAVDTGAYLEIMQASFATCMGVFASMAQRIHSHWDEIEVLSLQNSRYRVLQYLFNLVPTSVHGATTVILPARKAQIAAHLAVTPETLSRVFQGLIREGLIEMRGYRVHVPDVAALRGQ